MHKDIQNEYNYYSDLNYEWHNLESAYYLVAINKQGPSKWKRLPDIHHLTYIIIMCL